VLRAGRIRTIGLAALLAALAAVPAVARASTAQETILQDDDQLIFSAPARVARTLDLLASLGVDRVRVSVIWAAVAPRPDSLRRPDFDAADPAAYPPGAWDRYDTLVRLASARGIAVNFDLTSPAPYWAAHARAPASAYQKDYRPSAGAFAEFVRAVGRRYDGAYVPGPAPPAPAPPALLGLPLPFAQPLPAPSSATQDAATPLPAVRSWSIWNEPDEGGWLTPQWRRTGRSGSWVPAAPAIYRALADAGTGALAATGHGDDEILIGETAARGTARRCTGCSLRPLVFLRALYCVGRDYRPLTGDAARAVHCPASPDPAAFVAAHPALFGATGYAHHPYSFNYPPAVHAASPDEVPLADLPRLQQALDRIFAAYGVGARLPLYLTEYGYKSNPPNPFALFTPRQQAAFINQGEYYAYRDPRVRSMAQFLLVDDLPKATAAVGSRSYWSTFQTGLETVDGAPKPALTAFRFPIWLPDPRHGRPVILWGQVRVAPRASAPLVQVEFRAAGSGGYGVLSGLEASERHNFIYAPVTFPGPGSVRLRWTDPLTGITYRSRAVAVS
jgi:hypothetical protein